jgi:hypothetical protein
MFSFKGSRPPSPEEMVKIIETSKRAEMSHDAATSSAEVISIEKKISNTNTKRWFGIF